FWRSLTHWLGGMGIVVLTVAVFPLLGIGGVQLVKAESPGPTVDKITPKISSTAKILWLIYVLMTVAEILLLLFGGMDLFDAATHTFGTVATGGFSPRNASVGAYHSAYIDNVITIFMMLAGTNFLLYYRAVIGDFRSVLRNSELRSYIGIFVIATLLIAFNLDGSVYHSFGMSLRYASFQAASILTTTGFTTANYSEWPAFSQVVLFVLMFIGGSTGSTGGGMKVARIVILLKQGWNEMKYLLHPRGIFSMRMSGLTLRKDIVYTVTGFISLYIFVLFITTLVVASGGNDILTSLSAALATLGNIGPGFGRVGPAVNYAYLPGYIKWFLSFAMVVGRLEIYTVLVIFTRTFWRR
ncbi:MAG TPA: potassium transporter TrkG, partial [Spirochaetia bacterium]|nr:potassium transporter TrkG [Spirochaetia bacterium]